MERAPRLRAAAPRGRAARLRFRFGKAFHVSPFMPMDIDYDWRFSAPGPAARRAHGEPARRRASVFDATLALERREIERREPRRRARCAIPFASLQVLARDLLAGAAAVG